MSKRKGKFEELQEALEPMGILRIVKSRTYGGQVVRFYWHFESRGSESTGILQDTSEVAKRLAVRYFQRIANLVGSDPKDYKGVDPFV